VDQFSNVYYNEDEVESAPAASNTWYDKVTNTYTAEAADHLIIGSILYKSGNTSSSVGLNLLQGATVAQEPLIEHKDTTDYEACFMTTKVSLPAGSTTDKIQYRGESTSARVINARLISLQLPIQHTVEVEFTGSSDTLDWTQLVWAVDSAWTTSSITVTLQLYNYNLGQYPTSGDGYISYTSSATSNTDETRTQTITSNPTYFRDTSGNWKIKVKGVKSTTTQFDFKADLVKYETTTQVNTPPVLNPIGPKTINELSTLSFAATATDPDVPPQTLTFSLGLSAPSGASITSGGAFTWTPTEVQGPGVYNINITVSDGIATDYEVIAVTVYEVNVAPVLSPIGPKTINELSTLSFTATASDSDLPAQTLSFSLGPSAPSGASITSGGIFSWTPTEAQGPGVYNINITVSDGIAIDYEVITVTVNEVNLPPVLDSIGPKTINELATLSFTATASDPDLPAQTLTFSLGPGAPSGTSITSAGAFTWAPTEAQGPNTYVVRIIVSDGSLTDYEDITITVNEVNLPPVLSPIGSKSINEGALLQFTITASDPDIPAQTLTYSASNLPPGATFNPTTRVFSWTPTSGQAGVYPSVHFEVSDGHLMDSEDTTITVTAPPLKVSISPTSASILVGQSVTFTSAPSGGYPPYSYQWYLGGVQVSGATSSTWTFTPTTSGIYYVYLQVKDANNNIAQSETAKITVIPSAPVGGYSISLAKRTPTSQIAAYTLLIALFGAALSLRKRKRK
jgi:hypothetical protein